MVGNDLGGTTFLDMITLNELMIQNERSVCTVVPRIESH